MDTSVKSTIVVGVDGSEPSVAALRWAAAEATLRGAAVRVVTAWRWPYMGPYAPALPTFDFEKAAAATVETVVTAVFGEAWPATLTTVVREGPAAQVLLDAATDADLLVVSSRGHGEVAGLMLGSVSNACVHHATCPVVIVRGPAAP